MLLICFASREWEKFRSEARIALGPIGLDYGEDIIHTRGSISFLHTMGAKLPCLVHKKLLSIGAGLSGLPRTPLPRAPRVNRPVGRARGVTAIDLPSLVYPTHRGHSP